MLPNLAHPWVEHQIVGGFEPLYSIIGRRPLLMDITLLVYSVRLTRQVLGKGSRPLVLPLDVKLSYMNKNEITLTLWRGWRDSNSQKSPAWKAGMLANYTTTPYWLFIVLSPHIKDHESLILLHSLLLNTCLSWYASHVRSIKPRRTTAPFL